MENAFTKTHAEALRQFGVTEEKGLSDQQVVSARQKHGRNGPSQLAQLSIDLAC